MEPTVGEQDRGDRCVKLDQQLASALDVVEEAAYAYLARITPTSRDDLSSALHELDAVTTAGDDFGAKLNRQPFLVVRGLGTSSLGITGQTTRFPVVVQVPVPWLQAVVALVRAAKDELVTSTPTTFDALASAGAALTALEADLPPDAGGAG